MRSPHPISQHGQLRKRWVQPPITTMMDGISKGMCWQVSLSHDTVET